MSERIHAFGENGELSEGARLALDAYWLEHGGGEDGGGGGVTNHDELTGRSQPNQHPIGAITGLTATLANKSDVDHEHSISDVQYLQIALDNKAESGHNHDDRYYTETEVDTALEGKVDDDDPRLSDPRPPTQHGHPIVDVIGLESALAGKASIGHDHDDRYLTETEVKEALDGKADVTHKHPVTDLTTTGTPDGTKFLRDDGTWATPSGGDDGVTDHNDLTGRSAPDQHPIGAVTGLQSTLDGKADDGHGHTIGEVEYLQNALDNKAESGHDHDDRYYTEGEVDTALAGKADTGHQHPIGAVTGLQSALDGKVDDDDPRLSDAREPTAHSHPEYLTADDVPEFPDISDVIREGDARLSDPRPPTEHRHAWSDLDDTPDIPATPEDIGAQPAGDYATRDEIPEVPPPPDLSGFVTDDDPRLSDAREPTEHDHDGRYVRTVNGNGPDETGNVTVEGGGGEGGTDDHRALSYRAAPDAHPISAITGLTDALDSKQPVGDYLTSEDLPEPPDLSDVVREGDPRLSDARTPLDHRHDYSDLDGTPAIPSTPEDIGAQPAGDYLTPGDLPEPPDLSGYVQDDDPRLSDARTPTEHNHDDRYYTETEVDTALAGKANTSHQHPISGVTGLQSELNGKADTVHTHTAAQISDATTTGRAVLQASSATAARTAIGAGTSNLALGTGSTTAAAGNHTHDGRYYTETEVDTALAGKANTSHQHPISDVTGLQSALDDKVEADHGHTLDAVTDTASRVAMTPAERTKLGGVATNATANATDAQLRARSSHTGTQAISTVTGLQSALDNKAETDHTHTAAEISDATNTGRAVMRASSAAAARSAIGAGTSNLSLGTTAATAAAGNHTHDEYAPATQDLKVRNGYISYPFIASDAGKVVTLAAASAITATVPASVFTAGQRIDVIQRGAGAVTLVGGTGMTLHGTPSLVTRAQWSAVSVLFLSATEGVVIGDLAEPSGTGGTGGRG